MLNLIRQQATHKGPSGSNIRYNSRSICMLSLRTRGVKNQSQILSTPVFLCNSRKNVFVGTCGNKIVSTLYVSEVLHSVKYTLRLKTGDIRVKIGNRNICNTNMSMIIIRAKCHLLISLWSCIITAKCYSVKITRDKKMNKVCIY